MHGPDDTFSLGYDGSWVRGLNYNAGGDGRTVHSARYESRNHEVTLGVKGKVVAHARYAVFQMAEVAVPRNLFRRIIDMIADLRSREPASC